MSKHTYHNGKWDGKSFFVFGSNLAGRHGAGAAKYAMQVCGAKYGQGVGLAGLSYAIPTKDECIVTLPLPVIKKYVEEFLVVALNRDAWTFFITAIGTGLAGYKHSDIAPMFKDAPENCVLPIEWKEYVEQ